MKQTLLLIVFGLAAIFLQTWFFPLFIPRNLKPDLFLFLVVYVGIYAGLYRGAVFSLLCGCFLDSFAGNAMGLHGLVLLIIHSMVYYWAARLNTEAASPFYYLISFGTLMEAFLVCFFQGFFTDSGMLWYVVLENLLPQVMLNLLSAFILLKLLFLVRRWTEIKVSIPGVPDQDVF